MRGLIGNPLSHGAGLRPASGQVLCPRRWADASCPICSHSYLRTAFLKQHIARPSFPWLGFFLLVLFGPSGCGNVGDPHPPSVRIPQKVSDLSAIQIGKGISLAFSVPKFNTDGSSASTIGRIEIYRLRSPMPVVLPLPFKEFEKQAQLFRTIPSSSLPDKTDKKLTLEDSLPAEKLTTDGSLVTYAVRVFNRKNQSAGYSNLVSLQQALELLPPENLHLAGLGEKFIRLEWESPSRLSLSDSSKLKFIVYRSTAAQAIVPEALTSAPLAANQFEDAKFVLGTPYFYSVRTVLETATGLSLSQPSMELKVVNSDRYPPQVPADLTAISDGQVVSLVWTPNAEEDFVGYWIFRKEDSGEERRLNAQLFSSAAYTDKAVEAGKSYTYRVKAVDKLGNESDFSAPASEKVQ
jgi:hypothetical protein